MRPVIGASVHYVNRGAPGGETATRCQDATITEVHPSEGAGTLADLHGPEEVDLQILKPDGVDTAKKCRHSEGSRIGGTWHWPDD